MGTFPGMPADASAYGSDVDQLMWWVHALMALLFVGWGLYFIYVLVRFRASKHPQALYEGSKSKFSTYIEVGVAVVEGVLLVFYAVPAWAVRVADFPAQEEAEVIRVVAQQFAWNVHYPGPDRQFGRTDPHLVGPSNVIGLDREDPAAADDVVTLNQMHVPTDKPILIYLSTLDVIHSFYLPQMRVKQDAIPGMVVPIWFQAAETTPEGEIWNIACAQLCGNSHYRMKGIYVSESQADFDAWIQSKLPKPPEPKPVPEPEPATEEEEAATA